MRDTSGYRRPTFHAQRGTFSMQTTTRHRQMPAPTSSDRGATYWKTILFGFADGFTRPSFAIFWRLVIAWVVCPGRHPITRLSLPAEPDGRRAHDAYHRFLRIGAWSSSGGDWRSWPSRALPTGQAAAGPTPPSRGGAGRWRAAAAPGPDALDRSGPGLRQPPQPPQRGPAASTRGWDAARAARLRAAVPPAGADPDRAGRGHAPGAGGVAPGAGVGGGGGRASCPLARAGLPRMVQVVARADVAGVSTRRAGKLVQNLGIEGIGPSLVSEMARELDQ